MEKMRKQKKPAGIIFCCMLFWAVSWNALAVCADGTPEPEAVVESLTVEEAKGAAESENLSEIPNAYADILAVDSVVQEPIQTSGVDGSAEALSKESIVLSEEPVAAEEPTDSEESVSLEDPAAAEEPVDSEESVLMEEPVAAEELVVTEEPDVDELVQLETDNGIVPAADSFESDGFVFEVSNGVAVLAGYTGSASSVTLPTSVIYGGTTYRISSVKEFAFNDCSFIKTLVIPDGITSLGRGAFKNCTGLSSITINGNIGDCHYGATRGEYYNYSVFYNAGVNADGLTVTFGNTVSSIPAYLFATNGAQSANDCVHMTSLNIGSGVKTIGTCAFYDCYDLDSVTFGDGLTDIGSYAFANNTSLKTVRLPDSLLNIQDHGFYNCTALTDLAFGSKTASIGEFCFENCTALGTVVFPQSLTALARGAFKNCTGLSSITINGNIGDCHYGATRGEYYNYSVFYNAGVNTDGLAVTFGNTVSSIPAYLFATNGAQNANDCVHMTSLDIGSGVKTIGTCAFYDCYDLDSVTFGDGLTDIGSYAFTNNTSLKTVRLPDSLLNIQDHGFYNCTALTDLKFGSKTASIGEFCFENCTALGTVVFPQSLTALARGAFKNCTGLSSITINGNIGDCHYGATRGEYYNYSVFYNAGVNADGLTVTFGNTVSSIPAYLFATNGAQSANDCVHMTSLDIGSGVKTIGTCAFYDCYDLDSVTLGEGLTDIGSYAFTNNTSLKTVRLPDSLLNIQDHGFYNCTALTDLTFGSKTASIGEFCFENCTALGTVTLPQSLTALARGAFKNCTGLSSITINGNIGDCHYGATRGEYYNYSVFYNAGVNTDGLTVTFGNTVSSIPAYLFATNGAQSTNDYVHMISLNIGSKVSSIGACAFYHCYDLTSVTLPAKVSAVGEYAFDNGAMKSVIAKGENCTFGEKAFTGDGLTITGYIGYSAHQYAKENGYAFEAIKLSTPKIKNVGNTVDGVWISWDKVEHAALYRIYAKTGKGSWKTIQDTDATSYTWTEATKGKKYTFRIQCINSEKDIYTSDISEVSESVKYKPVVLKAPKIKKVKNEPEGMKITWKKVTGAVKYRVYYKTDSGDWKKLKNTTSTSYTWTGAKPGEKYSFTVRMYDISGKAGPYNKTGVSKTYSV